MNDNKVDFELANKSVQQAYHTIIAELKGMLRDYPAEYRNYLVVKEPNVEGHPDCYFYHALVTLHLQKADHDYYIDYTRFQGSTQISAKRWLDISRCILKHTSKTSTVVDIEDFVSESLHRTNGYEMALKEFEAGMREYEPYSIESLT